MTSMNKALVIGVGPEKGLGANIAARFAREGLHVFVAGRTAQRLEQLVQTNRSQGARTFELDMRSKVEPWWPSLLHRC